MHTIRIVLDEQLLRAADRTARRLRTSRSALIREALGDHLKRLRSQELELRDREGYRKIPDDEPELSGWEQAAEWPEQ